MRSRTEGLSTAENRALRARAKRLSEFLFARGGVARLGRLRRRGGTLILAYHNIVPSGETVVGDATLHLPESAFAAQLDLLGEECDVVRLDTALHEPADKGGRPRIAITFDDGYLGALTAGANALERRRFPYTVFIAPAYLGGRTFWWDALVAEDERQLPPDLRTRFLWECSGKDTSIRDCALRMGRRFNHLPEHARCASESLLHSLVDKGRLQVASHSWSHANLAALDEAELTEELARPFAWIRERFPSPRSHVAYPYGSFSPAVERAAEQCGYHGGLRVGGGWFPRTVRDWFALPRLNVSGGLSADGFALRLSGFFCG